MWWWNKARLRADPLDVQRKGEVTKHWVGEGEKEGGSQRERRRKGVREKERERETTHWMYLRETFWVCRVIMVRMYICRAPRRRAASYFSSEPNRSRTTSLQL